MEKHKIYFFLYLVFCFLGFLGICYAIFISPLAQQAQIEKLYAQYDVNVSAGDKLYRCGDGSYQVKRVGDLDIGFICGQQQVKEILGFNISYNFT